MCEFSDFGRSLSFSWRVQDRQTDKQNGAMINADN